MADCGKGFVCSVLFFPPFVVCAGENRGLTSQTFFNIWAVFASLDEVVESGPVGVFGEEGFRTKGGNSFCRQMFFQVLNCLSRDAWYLLVGVEVAEMV